MIYNLTFVNFLFSKLLLFFVRYLFHMVCLRKLCDCRNHPDIAPNYDPLASTDINDHDDDPTPQNNGDNK